MQSLMSVPDTAQTIPPGAENAWTPGGQSAGNCEVLQPREQ